MTPSEKLLDQLHMTPHGAVVLHDPANMFYLTDGFTGEGVVYISRDTRAIITDSRYTEATERQAPDFRVVTVSKDKPHNKCLAELCAEDEITSIRFESGYVSVDAFEKMKAAVGEGVSFSPLGNAPQVLRQVKTPKEILIMRKAAAITSEAFDAVLPKIRAGMTEKELQVELDFIMYRMGADGLSFDTIIASGENGSLPHAVPGDRKLKQGDMITMDFGAKVGQYCSDMTRTVALGQPSPEMVKVYNTVLRAQSLSENAVAAGKNCRDIDKIARDYIDSQGYQGRFGHGLGHCVGVEIHEDPRLSQVCNETLKANMVVTVEPGIYIPGLGGVRIENSCLVKENGCEALTTAPKELIIL